MENDEVYTNKSKEKEIVLIQIFYLFIIPVLLLYYKIIPGDFRSLMLLGVTVILYGIVKHAKWTLKDIGLIKNWKKDLIPYALFTGSAVLFLFWLSKITPHEPLSFWWKNIKFLLLFIPLSVLQEIAFRGILMNMLIRAFKNPFIVISVNALIFALLHIIYLNAIFVLPFTFIAGIGFAWLYFKYPNLIMVSISHSILNFVAMILGFFILR